MTRKAWAVVFYYKRLVEYSNFLQSPQQLYLSTLINKEAMKYTTITFLLAAATSAFAGTIDARADPTTVCPWFIPDNGTF